MDFWIRVNKDLLTKMSFPKLKFKIETTRDKLTKHLLYNSHTLCLANRCLLPRVMIWQPAIHCPSKTCNRFRNKPWAKASLSRGNNLNHKLNRKTHSTVQIRDRCIQIASRNLHLRQKLEFPRLILTRLTKMRGSQCLTSVVLSTAIFSLSLTAMDSTEERFQVVWNKDFHNLSKLSYVSCSRNTMNNFKKTKMTKRSIQMKFA